MWRLTAEQRELRDRIREFALSEVRAPMLEVDETGDYPYEVHEALASQGFLGLAIPEEYGGGGATSVAFCAYIEELAKVSATASLMAAYVKLTALPIILAGSDEQKERFLPQLASGEKLGSYALTEPGVGSDPAALEMKAERSDGGWLLNGEKRFIGNAGISDIYVVFARSGDPGPKGISAFVVPGDADGLSAERLRTMGMPGWRLGAPRFENVEVPEENLLGQEGAGFAIAMQTFDHSRPTVASQAVGVGQGAIDLALDYAVRRHTFGQPLSGHEGIQFKLARLEAEVAAARSLAYQAATFVDEDEPRKSKISAAAKLFATDVAMRATVEAVQVLGGDGYLKEFPAERMMRDAKVFADLRGSQRDPGAGDRSQDARAGEGRDPIWPESMPGGRGHRERREGAGGRLDAGGLAREGRGQLGVDLAVEGQPHVAAGHLHAARIGHHAGAPAHHSVPLRVDRGDRDLLGERGGIVVREAAVALRCEAAPAPPRAVEAAHG
jgi:alkylation response protein AidB-like acyl-CoA dehydrogenase